MITFVATPIGNLKDITLRALETLRAADVVFCEDTRVTLKLLSAYDIRKPLIACHKFNEREAAEKMIALSREGKQIAVVSDAGMPVISDPGGAVSQLLLAAGEPFTVAPGACALTSAAVLSGTPMGRFAFLGFLPEKAAERNALLARYKTYTDPLVFYCAPHDLDGAVAALYAAFGEREAVALREITKLHEERVPFTLKSGYAGEKRGEFVLIVAGAAPAEDPMLRFSVREHVQAFLDLGYEKKEAIKLVARDRGIAKSEVYRAALDL